MRHGSHDSHSSIATLSRCGYDGVNDDGNRYGGHSDRHRQNGHGERLGWGREGRLRLEEPLMYPSRRSSTNGSMGAMRGLGGMGDLGGLGGMGGLRIGGGGPFGGGPMPERLRRHRLGSGSGSIRDQLLDSRRSSFSDSSCGLGSRLASRDRLNESGQFMSGGLHSGFGSRASLSSLGSGTSYNLQQFDRRPRQYHWQPPHVEDDFEESMMEEEMYRKQEEEMMARGMIPGDNFEGPIFEEDFLDPRHRRF
jgi:hypothetical protein